MTPPHHSDSDDMTQEEFNEQWMRDNLPDVNDDENVNAFGMRYSRPLTNKQRADRLEEQRINNSIDEERADRHKLDALANRKAYTWKRRSMLQRGRRY